MRIAYFISLFVIQLLLVACSSGDDVNSSSGGKVVGNLTEFSGTYGGDECEFAPMTFKSDGTAYINAGVEMLVDYTIDGDKISITTKEGKNVVFTKNGDVLELKVEGLGHAKCKKMGS